MEYAAAERVQPDRVTVLVLRRPFDDERRPALLRQPGGERESGDSRTDDQGLHGDSVAHAAGSEGCAQSSATTRYR